jgi:SH3-like domain-containing protein
MESRNTAYILAMSLLVAGGIVAAGQRATAQGLGSDTGLPIPRFVSLRSDEVNLRTGPRTTYPVEWVYVRRDLPVEVTAEFDAWRRIRDWQGTSGWVHQSMITGRRTVRIAGSERNLLREPDDSAPLVARLAPGVIGRLMKCNGSWCRIEVMSHRGWLKRNEFWGTYPNETIE